MEDDIPAPSLQNLIDQKSLKWIFVGGKGGVGKTTTSSCLGLRLARNRNKVLIISTDPAHNLSDSFGQKFTSKPTKVNGIDNLEVMEIDPKIDTLEDQLTQDFQMNDSGMSGISSFLKDLSSSIPGIDEAMSFAELMKQVQNMNYDVIVFDTAPTGHTLRLLSFPTILEKAFDKIMSFKNKFSGPLGSMMSSLVGGDGQNDVQETFLSRLDQTREIIQKVNAQFQDPNATTFVCVCIPEFLSLYETERLVQELSKNGIDVHNIVVNQILYPLKSSQCIQCLTRRKMQQKYINQIYDLYEDFHVVEMPQLNEEVRGIPKLEEFSKYLVQPYYIDENEKEAEA